MGTKRPFEEELQELSARRPKYLDNGDKLSSYCKVLPSYDTSQKINTTGNADAVFHKMHNCEGAESPRAHIASDLAESFSNGEDAGSPEYFDFNIQRRTLVQFEDLYSYLLSCPPSKEVPIGPNYQVNVPIWDPEASTASAVGATSKFDGENGLKMLGTCVNAFSKFETLDPDAMAGDARRDCCCPDGGSIRCVQQHVDEAREKLREMLGHEKFVDLGFNDMGEVVAHGWTEEEELVFNEVVYSNPASLGKNFWDHLPFVLPSRTKKELVSYYFNVFMLRKRAAQNRSSFLEINSDDDEWRGEDEVDVGHSRDSMSTLPSFLAQDANIEREEDSETENGENSLDQSDYPLYQIGDYNSDDQEDSIDKNGEDEDDDDYGNYRSTINVVCGKDAAASVYGGRDGILELPGEKAPAECRFDKKVNHADISEQVSGKKGALDSHSMDGDTVATATKTNMEGIRTESNSGQSGHGNNHGSSDGMVSGYMMEPCDTKVWDAAYSIGPTRRVDLLPTRNMIEEIFGPSSSNSKANNDESVTQ